MVEVGGIEPPSSNARRAHLQVCPSVWLSGPEARDGAPPWPLLRFGFPPAPRMAREVSPGQLQTFPALRAALRGVRRSTLLTRRERGCRCCWQVKVLPNVRRSASPPAARDTDRTSRNRCTPCRGCSIVPIEAAQRQQAVRPGPARVHSAGTAASMVPPPRTRPSSE